MFTSMLYEDYLQLTKYEASVATAIVIGLSSLLIIVGGVISDKYRPRTSIIISSIGVFIGATALVFIADFGNLVIRDNKISNNSGTVTGSAQAFGTAIVNTKATCIFENNQTYTLKLSCQFAFCIIIL